MTHPGKAVDALQDVRARTSFPVRTLLVSVLLAVAPAAMADVTYDNGQPEMENTDTLDFLVGEQIRYDDNLFKLDDGESPKAATGHSQKSDWTFSTNAGIRFDKTYSLQRFQVEAMAVDNRYRTYDFLDFTAFNYHAAWFWHLTPRISGILLAEQKQELNNFTDFRNIAEKSIQTSQTRLFTVDGEIGGGLHLIGGLLDVRSRNSQSFEAVGDYQQDGYEAGVKYVAPSNNWISILRRETNGQYNGRELDATTQLDTGFDQSETEVNATWRFTGKSAIDAKVAYLDREHDHFHERDYSGMTGRLQYRWNPTGKLQINTSISRNLFSFQEDINSYYVADTFSIGPIWQFSPKTTFRARYDYSNRDYHGAIIPVAEMREDHVQTFMLAADWQATRKILVTATLQRDQRDSNIAGFDYDANSAMLNAQFMF